MIDTSISNWLPDDPELSNFYKGVNDFVTKHVDLESAQRYSHKKVIIDPCVGYIEIYPWEVTLLDTHIFQQLRKITQLGLAYLVFPTLRYSRFEHTLGVLGRLDQLLKKLRDKHKDDKTITDIIDDYETTLRLAALFHDLGHCLFSHLSESVINNLPGNEIADVSSLDYYPSVSTIREKFNNKFRLGKGMGLGIAEIFSVVIMACDSFQKLLHNANFRETTTVQSLSSVNYENIPLKLHQVANFIAGIPVYDKPRTVFLAQLISSGLDADKLDYMSREEHFSGIKIEMDLERILNKIKIHKVKSGIRLQKGLEKYAKHIKGSNEEYFVLSIERGGQFAYEEFCVARLALYEKIYLHKKVRAAEQTLKNQLTKISDEIPEFKKAHNWLSLPESIVENETVINLNNINLQTELDLFGSEKKAKEPRLSKKKLIVDLSFIEKRNIPHRAFAFGPANATYDHDYYSLLDSALTKEDIEKTIRAMLSVDFWNRLNEKKNLIEFTKKIKSEVLNIIDLLLKKNVTINNHSKEDLEQLKRKIDERELEEHMVIDIPDYNRVVLSFETLHFEESSFQSVRWTIPIHRISHYYQLHRILAYVYYEKKYCDIICLACEKAALDFIGKEKGFRQVYEQRTFISQSVYDSSEKLKASIIKNNNKFYEEYNELLPINSSLQNDHTTDIINKVVHELNRYHSNKFEFDIKFQDVINYLRQFPDEMQEFMLEILSCIKVLHESALEPLFEDTFRDIGVSHSSDKINVLPLGTSFSSAMGMMKHFGKILSQYNIGNDTIENTRIFEYYDHFIFFDDNTNSGRQALNIIAKWCGISESDLIERKIYTDIGVNRDAKFVNDNVARKLKDVNTKITLCFITGTKDSEEFLLKHLRETCGIEGEISVKIRYYMSHKTGIFNDENEIDEDNIFSKIKNRFLLSRSNPQNGMAPKTRAFLAKIGSQLVQNKEICLKQNEKPEDHALGYCNRESTVIFYNSVPTSTITALWCGGKYKLNGGEEKEWIPLISRSKIN